MLYTIPRDTWCDHGVWMNTLITQLEAIEKSENIPKTMKISTFATHLLSRRKAGKLSHLEYHNTDPKDSGLFNLKYYWIKNHEEWDKILYFESDYNKENLQQFIQLLTEEGLVLINKYSLKITISYYSK